MRSKVTQKLWKRFDVPPQEGGLVAEELRRRAWKTPLVCSEGTVTDLYSSTDTQTVQH